MVVYEDLSTTDVIESLLLVLLCNLPQLHSIVVSLVFNNNLWYSCIYGKGSPSFGGYRASYDIHCT